MIFGMSLDGSKEFDSFEFTGKYKSEAFVLSFSIDGSLQDESDLQSRYGKKSIVREALRSSGMSTTTHRSSTRRNLWHGYDGINGREEPTPCMEVLQEHCSICCFLWVLGRYLLAIILFPHNLGFKANTGLTLCWP